MESIWAELLIIFVLIIGNGFFAGSELAIVSARRSRIAQLAASGDVNAQLVERLQDDPHRFLATVQIGVTIVGSMASVLGGAAAVRFLEPVLRATPVDFIRNAASPIALGLVVVFISYVSLILGELVPKALAIHYADRMALSVAKPIHYLSRIGGLAVSVLTASSKFVLALLGIKAEEKQAFITREEVEHIVSEGRQTGVFSATEQEFIENIFDFTHTYVREVMVPRTRIIGLDLDLPRDEIIATVIDNQYSRYPVYRGSIDDITGFLHGKDLLGKRVTDPNFDISSVVRPISFAPEGQKVNDLLKEMQRKRVHMAMVVDEYGGISGLVTTEDLLEELVGEIEDEHDVGEPRRVKKMPDGSLLVDALIPIDDLADLLEVELEEDLPYDTLAGLILDKLGRFPDKGERLQWRTFLLICEEVTNTAVVKVRIIKTES